MNNVECMRRVTNYLTGCGHRKLQFVGNVRFSRAFTDRYQGYRSVLGEQWIPLNQNEEPLSFEGDNRSEMTEALEMIISRMDEPPTAFVCANDSIAICVMTVLASWVPKCLPIARLPALTTLRMRLLRPRR